MHITDYAISRRAVALGALSAAGSLALAGCGNSEETPAGSAASSGSSYTIGVLQLTQHAALDASNEGFIAALDDAGIDYKADQQNANNEQSTCTTIASQFANEGVDLILAIGTPAAQAAVQATADNPIPIIGTAITDFAASGLVASNEEPGGNLTGSSDMTPVADQIDLLQQLVPDVETVGLLYCSGESNSKIQIDMAKEALDAAGIAYEESTVAATNEIQSVVEALVGKIDALYAPTDNTVAASMAQVAAIADEAGVPTIVGCDTMVEDGGTASYSINYFDLGYRAGEMAVRILTEGADPAEMPIEYLAADECTLIANQASADATGVDLTALDGAEIV